jgi:hypothetical protein
MKTDDSTVAEHFVVSSDQQGWTCHCGHRGRLLVTSVSEQLDRHLRIMQEIEKKKKREEGQDDHA